MAAYVVILHNLQLNTQMRIIYKIALKRPKLAHSSCVA